MYSTSPLATIGKTGEEAIPWSIKLLEKAGLLVVRTFDLQGARLAQKDCSCPHHGTQVCDCQISVLLIYHREHPPASILVHSFQETTWLYLVDTPEQPVDKALEMIIRQTMIQPDPSPIENNDATQQRN